MENWLNCNKELLLKLHTNCPLIETPFPPSCRALEDKNNKQKGPFPVQWIEESLVFKWWRGLKESKCDKFCLLSGLVSCWGLRGRLYQSDSYGKHRQTEGCWEIQYVLFSHWHSIWGIQYKPRQWKSSEKINYCRKEYISF